MAQFTGTDVSSLCSLLPRPILMTGLFRDLLIRHFSSASNIEDSQLRNLLWKNADDTGILVESVHRWRPDLTEKRPAVIIKRNAYQNERKGIGDIRQGPPVDREGFAHYATFWTGSHTLFCIGGSGAQAEILGAEVQRYLTEFSPVILTSLDLKRFQVLQIGAVAEIEEAQENFAVPITVGYTFEQRWILRPQVPLLTTISKILELD
jgi:hypothetical protein